MPNVTPSNDVVEEVETDDVIDGAAKILAEAADAQNQRQLVRQNERKIQLRQKVLLKTDVQGTNHFAITDQVIDNQQRQCFDFLR